MNGVLGVQGVSIWCIRSPGCISMNGVLEVQGVSV